MGATAGLRRLDWLIGVTVGLQAGALFLGTVFNSSLSREVRTVLLAPKTKVSEIIGQFLGWDQHLIDHDPIGLIVVATALSLAATGLCLVLIRSLHQGAKGSGRASAIPGLVAVLAPWVAALLLTQPSLPDPQGVLGSLMLVWLSATTAACVSLTVWAVLKIHGGQRRLLDPAIGGTITAALLLWLAIVVRALDFHRLSFAFAVLVLSTLTLVGWANQVNLDERRPRDVGT